MNTLKDFFCTCDGLLPMYYNQFNTILNVFKIAMLCVRGKRLSLDVLQYLFR